MSTGTLSERVSQAFQRKKAGAKDVYYRLMVGGADADEIAAAAGEAGFTPADSEGHARILEEGAELARELATEPAAKTALAAAVKRYELAESKLQATIKPLQKARDEAAVEVQRAAAAVERLKPLTPKAYALWRDHPQLLSATTTPESVKTWLAQQAAAKSAEVAANERLRPLAEARAEVERLRQKIHRLTYSDSWFSEIVTHGGSFGGIFDPKDLPHQRDKAIAAAEKELAEAQEKKEFLEQQQTK